MATPIGHSLAGLAVYSFSNVSQGRKRFHWLLLCLIMAIFPDFDFLPGLLMGSPALYHQGVTHSIGFAIIVSMIMTGIYKLKESSFYTTFNLCFIAYLSHLVIDFFGPDGRSPYGVPLFWPISDMHFMSPIQVFMGMHHAGSAHASTMEWVKGVLDIYNLGAISLEVVLIAPFILLGKWYRKVY